MIILGLHFGHDASLSLIVDGKIVSHLLVERHLRVKQSVGIRTKQLETLLSHTGTRWKDIDYCALVSTQDLEILTGLIDDFDIRVGVRQDTNIPSPLLDLLNSSNVAIEKLLAHGLRRLVQLDGDAAREAQQQRWKMIFPEWQALRGGKIQATGWLNNFTMHERWQANRTLADIFSEPLDPATFSDQVRLGMHLPVAVTWRGHTKPGFFIDHHVCHAASTYYRSGFDQSGILTQDGGDGRRGVSGLIAYGEAEKLFVLAPHHLALGGMYRAVGITLGFDLIGSEGKLMGLSSYGNPVFFQERFVGNCFDAEKIHGKGPLNAWFTHCLDLAKQKGYQVNYGDPKNILNDFCKDVASSTQRLLEQTYLRTVMGIYKMLNHAGRHTRALCLSGGTALNCPSNSRIFEESKFDQLFIEPNCDDGGLSIGSALYLYHNMLGKPVDDSVAAANRSPYLGVCDYKADIDRVVAGIKKKFEVTKPENLGSITAQDLKNNHLIAWFQGRSEMGPRALCHRSLLANPLKSENWTHVNRVKGREAWRPLAPIVLENKASHWFKQCPEQSRYMLFTGQVANDRIPAVTHVDGSARVQTVTEEAGSVFDVLTEFDAMTGCPVAINTSLNRPGEPIVETPQHAVTLFEETEVDVLYLDTWRIAKSVSPDSDQ